MLSLRTLAALLVLLPAALCAPHEAQQLPASYLEMAQARAAIEPTPMGDGHLGLLASGTTVQLRFPLPGEPPLAAALSLGNIVGYTGRGSSYQLVLRRDAPDGPVIYEGPVIVVGDQWNAANRAPIDITAQVTDADLERGYLDIFATGIVQGDGWTMYRHDPGRREITIAIAEATPELRRLVETLAEMIERDIAVIPMPQDIALEEGALALDARSRIVLEPGASESDRFAAEDLAAQIAERTGLRLAVEAGAPVRPGDIALGRATDRELDGLELRVQLRRRPAGAYVVTVGETARAYGRDAQGLFYGAQTIAQLVSAEGRIPHCQVADWPSYPVRGLQYDVARGQTVPVGWWKRLIRELGRCKLNMLVVYGEDDYRFDAYPFLGREGTFTPAKARELSEYARRYFVHLVPQFESLGHASAVVGHEELAHLREAGGSWVFCTCNPDTWEFLDTVYGELAAQFPYSQYIHVGGDEFESGFGRCEACRARVAAQGRDALYAEHMNRLNALCRKHNRIMLFWPSHEGWTTRASDRLEKDCIPTEWIYHGPARYPQIQQYQELGFADVWVSPAVVCFSRIWPDYPTTWRGIRGFLQAGDERGVGGCMTTTWEWQHGGIVTNSLPGMFYAAECAWSLGRTPVADFQRRYALRWLGLQGADAGERLQALIEPWPREGPAAICYDSRLMTAVWWEPPRTALREYAMKDARPAQAAREVIAANDLAIERVRALGADAARNTDLLPHAQLAFTMCREAAHKLVALQAAADLYQGARQALPDRPQTAAGRLQRAAQTVRELAGPLAQIHAAYLDAAQQVGAAMRDVERIERLRAEVVALADELDGLAGELRAGERAALPPGAELGFPGGRYVKIGSWLPAQMSEDGAELRYDVTTLLAGAGEITIEWEYVRGAHGVNISRTALLADGEPVAVDEHAGWAGGGSHDNVYTLRLERVMAGVTYEVVGALASHGGTDSAGDVWLIVGGQ
ncbi:MAG: glycoside hydrolase family 20 zincin-like fold domain-containing protein [Armatimonadota bacterium]